MSNKTKTKTNLDKASDFAQQAGLLLMTAAATIGMVELPHHPDKRNIIVPNRPAFAVAPQSGEQGSTLRREREETAPHYVSYNVSQRTPGRTGRA